jgi:hypothetical protein
MWTRADARAEMARTVKDTLAARKILGSALSKLQALGEETGFKDDAAKAIEQLRCGALGEAPKARSADHPKAKVVVTASIDASVDEEVARAGSDIIAISDQRGYFVTKNMYGRTGVYGPFAFDMLRLRYPKAKVLVL